MGDGTKKTKSRDFAGFSLRAIRGGVAPRERQGARFRVVAREGGAAAAPIRPAPRALAVQSFHERAVREKSIEKSVKSP